MRRYMTATGTVHIYSATEYHGRNVTRTRCGRMDWRGIWRETSQPVTCRNCLRHDPGRKRRPVMDRKAYSLTRALKTLMGD
jgi:hypothetical protein